MALFIPILEALRDRLESAAYFADVPVVAIGVGKDAATHIEERIKRNLQKVGLSVELAVIRATAEPNAPGPYFTTIQVLARIIENPVVNLSSGGTAKPAFEVAENLANRLHHWYAATIQQTVFMTEIVPVPDDQFHIFDLSFTAHGGVETTTT